MKGRLKTYIRFSDDLFVYRFRGQSPRYRVRINIRFCSEGFTQETHQPVNSNRTVICIYAIGMFLAETC